MTREEIINGLQMTMDLIQFDPATGDVRPIYELNDLDKTTYLACKEAIEALKAQADLQPNCNELATDCISRQDAIDHWRLIIDATSTDSRYNMGFVDGLEFCISHLSTMPSAKPNLGKYEYHYDHTDCIWYRPEARNRCPATCAQYRDGWNDAMNYIFRDGKGYMPYRRDKQYGE